MLELLIKHLNLENLTFCLFAISLLISALFSVLSKHAINNILSFLLCSTLFSSIILLFSNMLIAIFIAVLYYSISSVLLLINTMQREHSNRKNNNKLICLIISSIIMLVSAACFKGYSVVNIHKNTDSYLGASEITYILAIMFLITASGIAFTAPIKRT